MDQEWWEYVDLPDGEPSVSVARCLEGAINTARDQLSPLNAVAYALVTAMGEVLVEANESVVTSAKWKELFQQLDDVLPNPWFRHGLELAIAEAAIGRASNALTRFMDLEPALADSFPSERSQRYLREAAQTYLFGFDGPCIVFCGAALEQILKEHLVDAGVISEKERSTGRKDGVPLTAGVVWRMAMEKGIVSDPENLKEAVTFLIGERNRAAHKHLWPARVIRQKALRAVQSLVDIIRSLEGPWSGGKEDLG